MIKSVEEFIRLRNSDSKTDQKRASHDQADLFVWIKVIDQYPEYKIWVIHNKSVPLEILEKLANDIDPEVRSAVARKRKINTEIINILSVDEDENVRYALLCNTKLTEENLEKINVQDSEWLKEVKFGRTKNASD